MSAGLISRMDALHTIDEALSKLPELMRSNEARVMLLAIALQESGLRHRRQINGPARGFWQFEVTGVRGVLKHRASRALAILACDRHKVAAVPEDVHPALADDDILAATFARLLLWTDPSPMPEASDAKGGWTLYLRTWRPGKPHENRWGPNHAAAFATVYPRA